MTTNTSASSLYDYDRLLDRPALRPQPGRRRRRPRRLGRRAPGPARLAFPPAAGELAGAAASPRSRLRPGSRRSVGSGGPAGCAVRPAGSSTSSTAAPTTGALDAVGFDWYDPVASHAVRLPGHRTSGGRTWDPSRAMWDVPPEPAGLTGVVPGPGARSPPGCPCGWWRTAWSRGSATAGPTRGSTGGTAPATSGPTSAAVVDAIDAGRPVTAYLHWSLVDNYEWGSYEPRFGHLRHRPGPRGRRRPPGAVARHRRRPGPMRPAPTAGSSPACGPATARCCAPVLEGPVSGATPCPAAALSCALALPCALSAETAGVLGERTAAGASVEVQGADWLQ